MTSLAPTDLELMKIQIEALFTHDDRGRIVTINEPDGGPTPRFFFGRTSAGNRSRVRHDLPQAAARRLEALAIREPVGGDPRAMPRRLDAMLAILGEAGEGRVGHVGPAYRFPEEIAEPAGVTRITASNAHLLRSMPTYFADVERGLDAYEPRLVVIEDGVAVSICNSARLTDRAAEAGVDTLADYRGRGYAAKVVAAWALAIRETGRTPLYSTSWDNLASQAVARRLGLVRYGADLSLW
ncbi:MAG: GNAT family N-acetyltransferase [Thermomicrobiales bacterium]